MVHRAPFAGRGIALEEGKIGYPEKVELIGVRQALKLSDAQTQSPEYFAGDFPLVGREEDEVAFFNLEPVSERLLLILGKNLAIADFHSRLRP